MQKPSPAHRLLTLAALLAALPAAAAPDITDLGTLKNDNSEYSQANAVNSDGSLVVGGGSQQQPREPRHHLVGQQLGH